MEPKKTMIEIGKNGDKLSAWIYSGNEDKEERIIVYLSPIALHGGWFKEALEKLAAYLKTTIIAIDLPRISQGENGVKADNSAGLRNKFSTYYDFELMGFCEKIRAVICRLKENFQAKRAYALGSSLGGVIQSYVLAQDKGKCLDGAIFQAGFASSGEEMRYYVWPPILKLPQWRHYNWIKERLGLPIPVFLFVRWSKPAFFTLAKEFGPTIRLLYEVVQDPDTAICFSISTLESLINAPTVTLPANVPILFLRSEKDRGVVNQNPEVFLERHPCSKTIVSLPGAPHIIFESEKHTRAAIKVIKQWLEKVEGQEIEKKDIEGKRPKAGRVV